MILWLKRWLGRGSLHYVPDSYTYASETAPKPSFRDINIKLLTLNGSILNTGSLQGNILEFGLQDSQQDTDLQLKVKQTLKSTKRVGLNSDGNKWGL